MNETSACALAFFNEHSGHKLCFFRRTTLVIAILDQFIKPIEAFGIVFECTRTSII